MKDRIQAIIDYSFNSRTPGGVRHEHGVLIPRLRLVSIHAPREGCDVRFHFLVWVGERFNSRTPGGVRRVRDQGQRRLRRFNSRTPGGVRRDRLLEEVVLRSFNSRTPGGVRHWLANVALLVVVFQFTHPGRGATQRSDMPPSFA